MSMRILCQIWPLDFVRMLISRSRSAPLNFRALAISVVLVNNDCVHEVGNYVIILLLKLNCEIGFIKFNILFKFTEISPQLV
jgi:hypothetical protein